MEFRSCKCIGFSKYEISKCGTVIRRIKDKRELKIKDNHGYKWVRLYNDNIQCVALPIHRIVLSVFSEDIRSYPEYEIEHINGIRADNRLENLKYVTHKENMQNPITKKRLSDAFSGINNPMYGKPGTMLGKKFSEEHKRKISESIKSKHR